MATSPNNSASTKIVHYVIAVHGIGEQRKNETVLPVISQFAAVRHGSPEHCNPLTLGLLASQSATNLWIELDEIPAVPDKALHRKPWLPKVAASASGDNIRFLDFVWSDVTRKQHSLVGRTVKDWSDALINRLVARNEMGTRELDWIIYLMRTMQKGVLLVKSLLDIRAGSLSSRIFNDFLGDVELYGDCPRTRGRAVRLFHETMAALHTRHMEEFGYDALPQYTIIAHSLGTVMTMDAITYAHAGDASRSSDEVSADPSVVHFPGYDGRQFSHEENLPRELDGIDPHNPPPTEWVKFLRSYVTLGSPIDKYLAMWTENYHHLAHNRWLDEDLVKHRATNKIRHFNYSDEQDPVGFELNILRTTPVWETLFENGEDVVFVRYPFPGEAHVAYWNDYELMHRILDLTIDERDKPLPADKHPPGHYAEWFEIGVHAKALCLSYIAVPAIVWLLANVFVKNVYDGFSANAIPWMSMALLLATLGIGHYLMELIIMWRLLVIVSSEDNKSFSEKQLRKLADRVFRGIIYCTPVLWAGLFAGTWLPGMQDLLDPYLSASRISLGMAFLVSANIFRIYVATKSHWKSLKETIATSFSVYLQGNTPQGG